MILILSTHISDFSTDSVMDWLEFKSANYKRINGHDFITNLSRLELSGIELKKEEKTIDLNNVSVFWYRRFLHHDFFSETNKKITKDFNFNEVYSSFLDTEIKRIKKFMGILYQNKFWLSDINKSSVNKLQVLKLAKEKGLEIPKTLITTQKEEVIRFNLEHPKIIVKPISEAIPVKYKRKVYLSYTSILDSKTIKNLSNNFFPSLIQEYIKKLYEIRVFYLDGEFYSMAIFSQEDKQTEIDFRKYNNRKPNRYVPYKLPNDIEIKIKNLMMEMKLNNGSIDMIRSTNSKYYFLEINPVGQFGMTSIPCNYRLEEKIADLLIAKDN